MIEAYNEIKKYLTPEMRKFAEVYISRAGQHISQTEMFELTGKNAGNIITCREMLKGYGFKFTQIDIGGGRRAYTLSSIINPELGGKENQLWALALNRKPIRKYLRPMKGSKRKPAAKTDAWLYHSEHGLHKVTNARQFSREWGLSQNQVSLLIRGDKAQYRGWRVECDLDSIKKNSSVLH